MFRFLRVLRGPTDWTAIAKGIADYVPSYFVPLDLVTSNLPEEMATYVNRDAAGFFLRNTDLYSVCLHPKLMDGRTYIRYQAPASEEPNAERDVLIDYSKYELDPEVVVRLSLLIPNEYVPLFAPTKKIIYRKIPSLLPATCAWSLSHIAVMYPTLFDVWEDRAYDSIRLRSRVSPRGCFGKIPTSVMIARIATVLKQVRLQLESRDTKEDASRTEEEGERPWESIPELEARLDESATNALSDWIQMPLSRLLLMYPNTFSVTRDEQRVSLVSNPHTLDLNRLVTWFRPPSDTVLDEWIADEARYKELVQLASLGPEGFVSRPRPKAQKWGKKRQKEAKDLVGIIAEEEADAIAQKIADLIPVDTTVSFNSILPTIDPTIVLKTRAHSMSTIRFLKRYPHLLVVEENGGDHTIRRADQVPTDKAATNSVAGPNPYMDEDALMQLLLMDLDRTPGVSKSIAGLNSSIPSQAREAVKKMYGSLRQFVSAHPTVFKIERIGESHLIRRAQTEEGGSDPQF